jgi:hypothetical protein
MLNRSRLVCRISGASVMIPSTAETLAVKESSHERTMITVAKVTLQTYPVLIVCYVSVVLMIVCNRVRQHLLILQRRRQVEKYHCFDLVRSSMHVVYRTAHD